MRSTLNRRLYDETVYDNNFDCSIEDMLGPIQPENSDVSITLVVVFICILLVPSFAFGYYSEVPMFLFMDFLFILPIKSIEYNGKAFRILFYIGAVGLVGASFLGYFYKRYAT
jgi:hypothetical protein